MTTEELEKVRTALKNCFEAGEKFKSTLVELDNLEDFISKNEKEILADEEISALLLKVENLEDSITNL